MGGGVNFTLFFGFLIILVWLMNEDKGDEIPFIVQVLSSGFIMTAIYWLYTGLENIASFLK